MNCNNCGFHVNENLNFCTNCGSILYKNKTKMNKKSKIFLITYFSILAVLLIMPFFLFIIGTYKGFKNVKKLEPDKFISYVESMGCKTSNNLDENNPGDVEFFYSTIEGSCDYAIGYMIVPDENSRNKYFENLKSQIKDMQGLYSYSYITNYNYNEYITEGKFYNVVSMYDDSILYLSVTSDHKEEAISIREDLGYYIDDGFFESFTPLYIALFFWSILLIISWWKLNIKFGRKGWVALIPIYNLLCLGEDLFGKKIYGILLLIPIVNIVCIFIFGYRLGKVLGKDDGISFLVAFLPQIFIPIVAFDNSSYRLYK